MDRLGERQALDRVLGAARRGLRGARVVRGEPGVGKTSLLGYAVDSAAGFRVIRVAGVESELELGFAGLHRLLVSFLPAMAGLPQRQRKALGSAFGLIDGRPADRFGVGLAALSLLADAAAGSPLLCVVDDAQWLDQESLEVLAMVGRRVYAERIALVLGTRDAADGRVLLEGIPDSRVGGVPEDDALELLGSSVGGPLDPHLARRIVRETEGCPMAIIELVGKLTAAELSGAGLLPGPLPLSRRLEAHFLRQVRAWPATTQTLLLVAAAEPSGDPRLITRAAARLGSPPAPPEPAPLAGGSPARAGLLLEQAAETGDPFQQARMRRLQGLIRSALGQAQGPASILMAAARALEPFDAHLARATMLEALEAARVTGRFTATGESDLDICRAARAMPLPPGSPPGVADLLLDGAAALVLDGHAAAVPLLSPAIAGLLEDQSDSADALLWLGIACWAAGAVGDDTSLHELATRLEQRAREEGALGALSNGLLFLAMSELLTGSPAYVRARLPWLRDVTAADR